MDLEKVYSSAGPFTVECEGNPFLGKYRCWLTSDPEKKVLCEGSARDIGNYFEAVVSAHSASGES